MALNLLRAPGALPLLVGHRGARDVAPENTLLSFERALDDGANMLEMDVQLSADGHAVVMHDDRVDRTTDGAGLVSELSLAEIKRLDAGAWFGACFAGTRVPTLCEVLDWAYGKVNLLLELKYAWHDGFAPHLAAAVVADIVQLNMNDHVAFISYNQRGLKQLKSLQPQWPVGPMYPTDRSLRTMMTLLRHFPGLERWPVVRRLLLRPLRYTQSLGCDIVSPNINVVTPTLIQASHSVGFPISSGGFDWDYAAAIAMGIDSVSSDDPGVVWRKYMHSN